MPNLITTLGPKAADEVGINHEWVLTRLREMAKMDNNNGMAALKELVEIFDMKDNKKTSVNINAQLPLSADDMKLLEEKKQEQLRKIEPADYEVIDDTRGPEATPAAE